MTCGRSITVLVLEGLGLYAVTTLPVLAGVSFGRSFIERRTNEAAPRFVDSLAGWDGRFYVDIAEDGYRYDPTEPSNVAFFPAYPLAGRLLAKATGLSAIGALVLISQGSLAASFVVLRCDYARRTPDAAIARWGLLCLGLWPVSLFFRMAYAESLLLLLLAATLYAAHQRWPKIAVAAMVGLATAVRPVGIALLAPLLLDLWERTRSEGSPGEGNACGAQRRRTFRFVLQAICLLPIACWGLLAWMACQWAAFGDPFAFARTQALWSLKPATATAELQGLLTLEPFWSVYEPWSDSWWARHEPVRNPLFSLQFANPLLFGAVAGLVGWGALRGGLDRYEVSLSLLLLLIPYATHAFRSGMTAHARYACVAFPAYAVVGHWCAVRPTLGAALAAVSAVLLFAYSALFSAWYRIL